MTKDNNGQLWIKKALDWKPYKNASLDYKIKYIESWIWVIDQISMNLKENQNFTLQEDFLDLKSTVVSMVKTKLALTDIVESSASRGKHR